MKASSINEMNFASKKNEWHFMGVFTIVENMGNVHGSWLLNAYPPGKQVRANWWGNPAL